jgi:hypothetical protein
MTKIDKIREWIIAVNADEKLINTGVVLAGLTFLFKIIVENVPSLNTYFEYSFVWSVFSVIFNIGFTLFIVASIISGIWHIRRNRVNRKAILTLSSGIVMGLGALILVLFSWYLIQSSHRLLQTMKYEDKIMEEHAEDFNKPVLNNQATAMIKYRYSGAESKYFDNAGKQRVYIPSKEDIKRRETSLEQQNELKKAMAETELTRHELRRIIPIKAFVLIFPILLGLFMPASWIGVGQKKEANKSNTADR